MSFKDNAIDPISFLGVGGTTGNSRPDRLVTEPLPHIVREIAETPEVLRQQRARLAEPMLELAKWLTGSAPRLVVTCARGSSAHAATFGKHLIERHLGIPVAAMAPNIATVYGRMLQLEGQLFVVISQSGASDDLLECTLMAGRAGARRLGIVNDTSSALARACDIVLPMAAGIERSIAATKSFVATLRVLLELVATWTSDLALREAMERLPDRLGAAARLDWSAALDSLAKADRLVTLGRGPTLAIAREASLKLKETCLMHAEAFSGAEFLHGPIALVSDHCPVLVFTPNDAAGYGLRELAERLAATSGATFVAEPGLPCGHRLPVLTPDHPETDAVCLVQSFYAFVVLLAQRRGTDADRPPHLQKITRTR